MASNSSKTPPLEHCFHRVVEQSPSSIVITDPSGRIEYVNPAFERQTGYRASEIIGENPRALNAGTQPKSLYDDLWQTITAGREWSGIFHNRRKDGSLFWEKAVIAPIFDESGEIAQFIGIKEDITRLHEVEEQNRWFGAMLRTSPNICAVRDLNDRIIAVNDAYLKACGAATAKAVIGRTDVENFGLAPTSETTRQFSDGLRAARHLSPRNTYQCTVRLERNGGKQQFFSVNFLPIFDEGGSLVATATTALDVTFEREREQALEEALSRAEDANRAKSAFLGTVSHELRTPLNSIIGLAATLAEAPDISGHHRQSIDWIQRSGQLLLTQIEGLLQLTNLQKGNARVEAKPFSLLDCLAAGLRRHIEHAKSRELELTYSLAPDLPAQVVGDRAKLLNVIDQVLDNAVKFTDEGTIHLEARPEGGGKELHVVVSDTGIGIPADAIPQLFLPFFQFDASDTRRHGGAGLGLSIVDNLLKALRGTITVDSDPGEGSRFVIRVPLEGVTEDGLAAPPPHALLADHEVWISASTAHEAQMVRHQLSAVGARVREVDPMLLDREVDPAQRPVLVVLDSRQLDSMPARVLFFLERSKTPLLWLRSSQPQGLDPNHPRQYHLPELFLPTEVHLACETLFKSSSKPLATSDQGTPENHAEADGPLSILVVDDLESNRVVIRHMLRHLDHDPAMAVDGNDALEFLHREGPVDVVCMDLQMPGMDGFEATRQIRANWPTREQPFILALTANAEPGVEERCLEVGMDAYLAKPVTPAMLATALHRVGPRGRRSPSMAALAPAEPRPETVSKTDAHAAIPILDPHHLDAMVMDLDPASARELLEECLRSFEADCKRSFPLLDEALTVSDAPRIIEIVHGLKGSAALLGFVRFRETAQEALSALRSSTFNGQEDLLPSLQFLFERSIDTMKRTLETWPKSSPTHRP